MGSGWDTWEAILSYSYSLDRLGFNPAREWWEAEYSTWHNETVYPTWWFPFYGGKPKQTLVVRETLVSRDGKTWRDPTTGTIHRWMADWLGLERRVWLKENMETGGAA